MKNQRENSLIYFKKNQKHHKEWKVGDYVLYKLPGVDRSNIMPRNGIFKIVDIDGNRCMIGDEKGVLDAWYLLDEVRLPNLL